MSGYLPSRASSIQTFLLLIFIVGFALVVVVAADVGVGLFLVSLVCRLSADFFFGHGKCDILIS